VSFAELETVGFLKFFLASLAFLRRVLRSRLSKREEREGISRKKE
jgi:hypothetical protein